MDLKVTCIVKDDRMNPYERILTIGCTDGSKYYRVDQQSVVRHIDNKEHRFFVGEGSRKVWLVVGVSPYGNKYVKTEADGREPNNLLSLPTCA